MSEDIKQDLPDDADDDDDIIELVNVVEQGKDKEADEDLDFSANLESILDGMEDQEDGADEAFPDPNPVSYDVDHNESLDVPSMDDLDNLLESLGAEENAREQQSRVVDSSGDDLDAVDGVEFEDTDILGDETSASIETDRDSIAAALNKALSEKSDSGDKEENSVNTATDGETTEELDMDKLLSLEALEPEAFEEKQTDAKEELLAKTEKSEPKDPFEAALAKKAAQEGKTSISAVGLGDLPIDTEDLPMAAREEAKVLSEEFKVSEKLEAEHDPFEAALSLAVSKDLSEKTTIKKVNEEKSLSDDKEEGAMRSRIDEDLDELDALLDDMLAVSPAETKKEVTDDTAASTHLTSELGADDGLFMQEINELSDRINLLEQFNKSLAKEENISSGTDFGKKFTELQAALDEEKEKNANFKAELKILQDENKKINEEIEKLVAETAARVIREEISALFKDLQGED